METHILGIHVCVCMCVCVLRIGEVWPAVPGGGPAGSLPPHEFKLLFKEGGIGTFYPLYYTLSVRAKQAMERAAAQQWRGPGACVCVCVCPALVCTGMHRHSSVQCAL